MSCKGKTPKGVRGGGRVSWREQMTPGWSQEQPEQPGGLTSGCWGQHGALPSSGLVSSLAVTFWVTLAEPAPRRGARAGLGRGDRLSLTCSRARAALPAPGMLQALSQEGRAVLAPSSGREEAAGLVLGSLEGVALLPGGTRGTVLLWKPQWMCWERSLPGAGHLQVLAAVPVPCLHREQEQGDVLGAATPLPGWHCRGHCKVRQGCRTGRLCLQIPPNSTQIPPKSSCSWRWGRAWSSQDVAAAAEM